MSEPTECEACGHDHIVNTTRSACPVSYCDCRAYVAPASKEVA
jgi:hypothetical protein